LVYCVVLFDMTQILLKNCKNSSAKKRLKYYEKNKAEVDEQWFNNLAMLRHTNVEFHCSQCQMPPACPPIDSIMRLMTVWRITAKIIRTAIIVKYAQL